MWKRIVRILFAETFLKRCNLVGRVMEREWGRGGIRMWVGVSHPLVHSLSDDSSQGWAKRKPGARNCVQTPHIYSRDLSTWTILYGFSQTISRELDKSGTAGTLNSIPMGCWCYRLKFYLLWHNASPGVCVWRGGEYKSSHHFLIINIFLLENPLYRRISKDLVLNKLVLKLHFQG